MSFLAKLFIHGKAINILDTNVRFYRGIHPTTFQPTTIPMGRGFTVTIEADGNTKLLGLMLSPKAMCEGYIRFYKRDGLSKLNDYEFFDTYVVGYQRDFDGVHGQQTTDTLTFSPGILRIGSMVFEKPWKVTDLAAKAELATMPKKEDKKPKVHEGYYENEKGEKEFRPKKNDTVFYIAKTRDLAGKTIDVDLSDSPVIFEHEGISLNDGIVQGLEVTGNRTRIALKVLKKK